MKYDIIGDIHGHYNDLRSLLLKMGYGQSEKGHYYHPDRQVIFVGDYIDRGKYSREVVQLVRAMQENEAAIALMGNHEYNAICYHTPKSDGGYLRPRTPQNIKQHENTLTSFESDSFLKDTLDWFKQLPLFYENSYLRVVHACWDQDQLTILQSHFGGDKLKEAHLELSATKDNPLYEAMEIVLKGKELPLPEGKSFFDQGNHERKEVRIKWWEPNAGRSIKELAVKSKDVMGLSEAVKADLEHNFAAYPSEEKPVFFGHYWLEGEVPSLQAHNVCCVDYSVANKGKLVAYRFDGETELRKEKFCW
jgi:predicted MPP superfamily phosphohydrolase